MRSPPLLVFAARTVLGAACGATVLTAACGAQAAPAPGSAAGPSFDVEAYDVDGARLLRQIDVETAVYPFLGPGRTRDDIEHARAALEKTYHDRGYQSVVVEVPAQSVSDNIVRLHVVEAAVGRLRVTGSRYYSPETIRHQAPAFQEGQVPDINQAQKELTEINRLPDRRVTPLLRAGAVPGTVDVDLKVSDTLPLHASLELDNDHNQFTKPLRLNATVSYDNLWQLGHQVSFTYAVAPENKNDSEVFAGSYLAPLWNTPFTLLVFGYHSNSNVATLGGTSVLGKGYAVGIRSILQLPRIGDLSQSLSFGFDFKNFDENITFASASTAAIVEYVPATVSYTLQRDDPKYPTRLTIGLTAGVRGLGSDTATFENNRFDAQANFVHANLDLTQSEALGHGFEAAQRLSGQIADQPLVSSEQIAIGGLTSVRGYLQSEEIGDEGLSGGMELRSPSLAQGLAPVVDDLRLYIFGDGGAVKILDPLSEQADFFTLASTGLGLRFDVLAHLKGDVVLAFPLLKGAATKQPDHARATFSVKSEF